MTAVFESCMCDSIYRFVMFNVRYSLFDTYFPLLMCLFFYSVSLVSKITYMCAVAIEFYLKLTVNQFILLFMIWRGGKFLMSFHANSIWLLWVSWFFLFFFGISWTKHELSTWSELKGIRTLTRIHPFMWLIECLLVNILLPIMSDDFDSRKFIHRNSISM